MGNFPSCCSQLYTSTWPHNFLGRCLAAQGAGVRDGQTVGFEDTGIVRFARFDAVRADMVEIVVGNVVVRAEAGVDADHLGIVLRTVRLV